MIKRILPAVLLAGFAVAVMQAHSVLNSFPGAPAQVILYGLFLVITVQELELARREQQNLAAEPVRLQAGQSKGISHPTTTLTTAHSP